MPFVTQAGKDSTWTRTVLKMQFEIVDTETGYSETKLWFSADQDTGGKSMPQAVTEGCKRFKMKLFKFSSKGDVDPDNKTTDNHGSLNSSGKPATEKQIKLISIKLFNKPLESKAILKEFKLAKLEDLDIGKVNDVLKYIEDFDSNK
jgi:hypothetical protein